MANVRLGFLHASPHLGGEPLRVVVSQRAASVAQRGPVFLRACTFRIQPLSCRILVLLFCRIFRQPCGSCRFSVCLGASRLPHAPSAPSGQLGGGAACLWPCHPLTSVVLIAAHGGNAHCYC